MVRTFRQIATDVKTRFHLNPRFFGEAVIYLPFRGLSRPIYVHVYEEENLDLERVDTETRSRVLKIKSLRDPITGIDKPNLGDRIIRGTIRKLTDQDGNPITDPDGAEWLVPGENGIIVLNEDEYALADQDGNIWVWPQDSQYFLYMGEHDNECEDSWRLYFEWKRRDAQGFMN